MQNQQTQNGCSASLVAVKSPQLKVSKDGVYRAEPGTEFSVNAGNQHSSKQPFLAVVRMANDPITGSETTGILLESNTQQEISHWLYSNKKPFAFFMDASGQLKKAKKETVIVTFYHVVEKANGQKTTSMTALTLKNDQIANRKSVQALNQPVATIELPYANPTEWDRINQVNLASTSKR